MASIFVSLFSGLVRAVLDLLFSGLGCLYFIVCITCLVVVGYAI